MRGLFLIVLLTVTTPGTAPGQPVTNLETAVGQLIDQFSRASTRPAELQLVREQLAGLAATQTDLQGQGRTYDVAGVLRMIDAESQSRVEVRNAAMEVREKPSEERMIAALTFAAVMTAESADPMIASIGPTIDTAQALACGEPWITSGTLYLARLGLAPPVPAHDILAAWQRFGSEWDAPCISEVLQYLSTCPRDEIIQLHSDTPSIAGELAPLQRAAADTNQPCCVHFVFTTVPDAQVINPPVTEVDLLAFDHDTREVAVSSKLAIPAARPCHVRLEAGLFQVQFDNVDEDLLEGRYGSSPTFQTIPGVMLVVPVRVISAL